MSDSEPTIRTSVLPGLLLERYAYRPGPPSDYPAHVHETYQLGIALGRGGEYHFRRAARPVPTRALIIIHPGERHAVRDTGYRHEPTSYLMLYIEPDIVQSIAGEQAGRETGAPFFADPIRDEDVVRAYVSLFTGSESALERETRLVSLFGTLVERHAEGRRTATRGPLDTRAELLRVRDFLHDEPASDVPLQQLADLAGMSRFHLVRQFSRIFGVPPHTYRLQARIDRAKRLLAAGETGSRVALDTGFYDQSHFGRHFRRLVGVPPGRYRPAPTEQ